MYIETKRILNNTVDLLIADNTREYNILKSIEELQELSLILTQHLNKPKKNLNKEIIDEIGDVKIRIKVLSKLFSKRDINQRVLDKSTVIKNNIINKRHKGN